MQRDMDLRPRIWMQENGEGGDEGGAGKPRIEGLREGG